MPVSVTIPGRGKLIKQGKLWFTEARGEFAEQALISAYLKLFPTRLALLDFAAAMKVDSLTMEDFAADDWFYSMHEVRSMCHAAMRFVEELESEKEKAEFSDKCYEILCFEWDVSSIDFPKLAQELSEGGNRFFEIVVECTPYLRESSQPRKAKSPV